MNYLAAWLRALRDWWREEVRLASLNDWAEGKYDSSAGSVADPRVARMDLKQRSMGKRMRREGRSLLGGKPYRPETAGPMVHTKPKLKTIRLRDAA